MTSLYAQAAYDPTWPKTGQIGHPARSLMAIHWVAAGSYQILCLRPRLGCWCGCAIGYARACLHHQDDDYCPARQIATNPIESDGCVVECCVRDRRNRTDEELSTFSREDAHGWDRVRNDDMVSPGRTLEDYTMKRVDKTLRAVIAHLRALEAQGVLSSAQSQAAAKAAREWTRGMQARDLKKVVKAAGDLARVFLSIPNPDRED